MILHNFEQLSAAWHEIKLGRIGGTRFKLMMQADSTAGYKDLITDIAGEIITGEKEDTYQNAIMQRGTDLEPYARNEYEDIFETNVKQVGFITKKGEFEEWIGISPDGLIEGGLLEIKCPLRKTHLNYIKANRLPTEYKYQVQAQLFVTGLNYCDFMSHYPKMKPFIIRIYPDAEMHANFELELRKIIPLIRDEIEIYHKYNHLTTL